MLCCTGTPLPRRKLVRPLVREFARYLEEDNAVLALAALADAYPKLLLQQGPAEQFDVIEALLARIGDVRLTSGTPFLEISILEDVTESACACIYYPTIPTAGVQSCCLELFLGFVHM